MAKKQKAIDPAPLKEAQPENDAQEILVGLLKSADDYGVSMVEADWRKLSQSEENLAIAWITAKRRGVDSMLPTFLVPFATAELKRQHEAQLERIKEQRMKPYPCTFSKPGVDKTEEGQKIVCLKFKVPDSHMTGSQARELFGKTRVRIHFSRRPIDEWGPSEEWEREVGSAGPRRIIETETEVPSFGWADDKWTFGFRITEEEFSHDEAVEFWKNQGSFRIEVLGEAIKEDSPRPKAKEPKEPKARKPPKAETKPANETKALPGTSDAELSDKHSVALTDQFRIDIEILGIGEGKVSCRWTGEGPTGPCEEPEASVRSSPIQAAIASIGKAVDHWRDYSDEESQVVLARLRHWLKELEAGKSPSLIESEAE